MAVVTAIFLTILWIAAPNTYIPSPLEIGRAWDDLARTQGLLRELYASSVTVAKALLLSTTISLGLALLATAKFFEPLVRWMTALRFLGFAGITFLFTLLFGGGDMLKLMLLTFGMTVFYLTSLKACFNEITAADVDYVKTLGLSGWGITYELGVRGMLPNILDIMRQNAAIGWTMLSMVEGLVRSEGGIGAMLLAQNKHFHLDAVFAIQITILIYGIIQDYALVMLRRWLCPYAVLKEAK